MTPTDKRHAATSTASYDAGFADGRRAAYRVARKAIRLIGSIDAEADEVPRSEVLAILTPPRKPRR